MKFIFSFLFLATFAIPAFSQKSLISYDDIKYLLHNNLHQADTFLVAKGYVITKKDNDTKNRKYTLLIQGGTQNTVSMRIDGKKLFIEIETNEINQYNLIRESISQYLLKEAQVSDVQTYSVKDLGNIYITINDTVPYDPLKKDWDIQVVGDKHITAYD
jgi:hypothetical protein